MTKTTGFFPSSTASSGIIVGKITSTSEPCVLLNTMLSLIKGKTNVSGILVNEMQISANPSLQLYNHDRAREIRTYIKRKAEFGSADNFDTELHTTMVCNN